ncbi:MAG TPA: prepilin-type N-terminal cleavage/methylation domain-containing protein [bacterium]|nr:prepilin-type N-terminal cleavage/methylation domain-containing protein [bacterium]
MKVKIRQSGFSMIELLVALVILSVGILAIAQLQVAAIRTLTLSRHITVATQLALKEVEFLKTVPIPVNPNEAPSDSAGNSIKDGNSPSHSVLYDAVLGDSNPSEWHVLMGNPVNELGLPASAGEMKFYVRWSIERCCVGITDSVYKSGPPPELQVPGKGQIAIVMQVIWWESNKRKPATVDLTTTGGIDATVLKATNGHVVEISSIRTEDL